MTFRIRCVLAGCLATVALALAGSVSAADNYPSRTIHIVVPWKAGGGTDAIGRAYAQALKEVSGQDVVIDNINGASGAVGTAKVAHATPDGYTLILNGNADMNAGMAFRHEPYSLDDFVYIGGVYSSPTWLLSHKDRGYASFADFAKAARAHPGQVTIGVGGANGALMLMAAAIRGITGLDVRIIPYSGGADLKKALLGNQVDAGVIHAPVLLSEVKTGLIKVLATGAPLTRVEYPPIRSVSTLRQLNIPTSFSNVRVVMAPKGTPKEIIEKLGELSKKAVETKGYQAFGEKFGFAPEWTPEVEETADMHEQLKTFQEIKAKYIQ